MRCLLVTNSQCIRLQASLPGSVRPAWAASHEPGSGQLSPSFFSPLGFTSPLDYWARAIFASFKYLCILPSLCKRDDPEGKPDGEQQQRNADRSERDRGER